MFGLHVKAVGVVQESIPSFSHYWQRPPISFHIRLGSFYFPSNHRVAHHPHAVRIRDHHRAGRETRNFHPCCSVISPFPLSVNQAAKTASSEFFPARKYSRHPGPHWSHTDFQWTIARNQRGISYFNAFYVRDRINGPGVPSKGTPKSRARRLLFVGYKSRAKNFTATHAKFDIQFL